MMLLFSIILYGGINPTIPVNLLTESLLEQAAATPSLVLIGTPTTIFKISLRLNLFMVLSLEKIPLA